MDTDRRTTRSPTLAQRLQDDPLYKELGRIGRTREPLKESLLILCETLLACPDVVQRVRPGATPHELAGAARQALLDAISRLTGNEQSVGQAVFGIGEFSGLNVTNRKFILSPGISPDMYADLRPQVLHHIMFALGYDYAEVDARHTSDLATLSRIAALVCSSAHLSFYSIIHLDTLVWGTGLHELRAACSRVLFNYYTALAGMSDVVERLFKADVLAAHVFHRYEAVLYSGPFPELYNARQAISAVDALLRRELQMALGTASTSHSEQTKFGSFYEFLWEDWASWFSGIASRSNGYSAWPLKMMEDSAWSVSVDTGKRSDIEGTYGEATKTVAVALAKLLPGCELSPQDNESFWEKCWRDLWLKVGLAQQGIHIELT